MSDQPQPSATPGRDIEAMTMFRIEPVAYEPGSFDLTITSRGVTGTYWRSTLRLDGRMARAFKQAVTRDMATVPTPGRPTTAELHRDAT